MGTTIRAEGFESSDGWHHKCLVFPVSGNVEERTIAEIGVPKGWRFWLVHDPGTLDQPEARFTWSSGDPARVRTGTGAFMWFTFYRRHHAGLMKTVTVGAGTKVRALFHAHAWSNWQDGPHVDDPRWSEGPGHDAGYLLEGQEPSSGDRDQWINFTFRVGIDPTGARDPRADTVVWGDGAHIYNEYAQVPALEVTAEAEQVTVFISSHVMWPYKHCDAYVDDVLIEVPGDQPTTGIGLGWTPGQPMVGEVATVTGRHPKGLTNVKLVVTDPDGGTVERGPVQVGTEDGDRAWTWKVGPFKQAGDHKLEVASDTVGGRGMLTVMSALPQPERGDPRLQYERTYVLLPPSAGVDWAIAAARGSWEDKHRFTIGGSADDAGIGDLDHRRVIAVNPDEWDGEGLETFFEQHYAGVLYVVIKAGSPAELVLALKEIS